MFVWRRLELYPEREGRWNDNYINRFDGEYPLKFIMKPGQVFLKIVFKDRAKPIDNYGAKCRQRLFFWHVVKMTMIKEFLIKYISYCLKNTDKKGAKGKAKEALK